MIPILQMRKLSLKGQERRDHTPGGRGEPEFKTTSEGHWSVPNPIQNGRLAGKALDKCLINIAERMSSTNLCLSRNLSHSFGGQESRKRYGYAAPYHHHSTSGPA